MALAHMPSSIPRQLRRPTGERFVGGNRVTLLRDGREAFPAMLESIGAAERSVHLEMYWFAADRIGTRFAEALAARARAGVAVDVIFDSIGSDGTPPWFWDRLRGAGVRVLEYHPVAPWGTRWRFASIFRRDHRKLLVVDGAIAFTGGLNIGEPWMPAEEGGGGWRDAVIRVEGPAALEFETLFSETWSTHWGEHRYLEAPAGTQVAVADSPVRVLGSSRRTGRRTIRHAYLQRIYVARRFIYVTNSYFVPDRLVRRGLIRAARRGVDVRVMVPQRSDLWAVALAGRASYERLLRHGVRIFEWKGTVLHAKTAVIDGLWSTVGTFNMDHRSWRYNLEVNVAVEDEPFGGTMREQFLEDQTNCVEIDRDAWRKRPLVHRLFERFLELFAGLM